MATSGILSTNNTNGPVTAMDPAGLIPADWYAGKDSAGRWGVFHPATGPGDPIIIGLAKGQAELGALLMREEGVPWSGRNPYDVSIDLAKALAPILCLICRKTFAAAQVHNERCIEDQS